MKQYITHTHTLTHRRTHAVPDVDKTDATTLGFCLSTSERVWMSGQDSARRSLERFLRHITRIILRFITGSELTPALHISLPPRSNANSRALPLLAVMYALHKHC